MSTVSMDPIAVGNAARQLKVAADQAARPPTPPSSSRFGEISAALAQAGSILEAAAGQIAASAGEFERISQGATSVDQWVPR